MQTIGSGGSGSAWVRVDIHGEVVGSLVGEIEWGERGFTSNGLSRDAQ